jgi:hypothetical protein
VVGPNLYFSKAWKTFPDFLMDHFKFCVGEPWWKEQVARAAEKRHPLYHWYVLTCEYQKNTIPKPGEVTEAPMIGAVLGVMWFAYGLYLLRHNVEIQRRLLQRLLSDDEVQIYGALYEVHVAATMVWCGFSLSLEDEGDGSTTHCEFTATSKTTGKSYSVEAKVCDPGNIGSDGRSDRAVTHQLARALRKRAAHPRIIFIDLNAYRPPLGTDPGEWLKSRARALRRQERTLPDAPPAAVFLTSYPYRYYLDSTDIPRMGIVEGFKMPKLKYDTAFTLRDLGDFRAENADIDRVQEAFGKMSTPPRWTVSFRAGPSARGERECSSEKNLSCRCKTGGPRWESLFKASSTSTARKSSGSSTWTEWPTRSSPCPSRTTSLLRIARARRPSLG